METPLASKQTIARLSSHSDYEVSEGGRNVYPSDLQTSLEKLNVGHSDDRGEAEEEEMLESETSGPVSGRTRMKKKRRDASRINHRGGDDQRPAGSSRHHNDDGLVAYLLFMVVVMGIMTTSVLTENSRNTLLPMVRLSFKFNLQYYAFGYSPVKSTIRWK